MNEINMSDQQDKSQKISVSIGGISYQLVSAENEEYIKEIAKNVDDAIRRLMQRYPALSNAQATILALVNATDTLTKVTGSLEDAQQETDAANDRAVKAQNELFLLRDTDFELKKEIMRVNELNRQLELEIAALRTRQSSLPDNAGLIEMDQPAPRDVIDRIEEGNHEPLEINQESNEVNQESNEINNESDEIYCEYSEESGDEQISEILNEEHITSDLTDNTVAIEEQDIEDMVKEFLGDIQDPFAVSQEVPENPIVNEPETFPGFTQPSLDEFFS